jgi:type II secretory pathway pseudopilin PulG
MPNQEPQNRQLRCATAVRGFNTSLNPVGHARAAFSLVELIGVLAVLVILASLIVPRISKQAAVTRSVQAVSGAQLQQVLTAVQAIKTAATEHCARFGSLASQNGTPFAVATSYDNYDSILLSEQLLDRPFAVKLGTRAVVRLVNVSGLLAASRAAGAAGVYYPEGGGASGSSGASYLLEAVISGVPDSDAKALNDVLDGPGLGANPGEDDRRGSVTYRGGNPDNLREVHISILPGR